MSGSSLHRSAFGIWLLGVEDKFPLQTHDFHELQTKITGVCEKGKMRSQMKKVNHSSQIWSQIHPEN